MKHMDEDVVSTVFEMVSLISNDNNTTSVPFDGSYFYIFYQ